MERTRKEYLVLKSDQAGEADIVGVFSSRRKAKAAAESDQDENNTHSYLMVVLPEDRPVRMGKNESDMTKLEPLQDRKKDFSFLISRSSFLSLHRIATAVTVTAVPKIES